MVAFTTTVIAELCRSCALDARVQSHSVFFFAEFLLLLAGHKTFLWLLLLLQQKFRTQIYHNVLRAAITFDIYVE